MPFFAFTSSHIAGSHLSRPMGESSNTVSTLMENWRRGCSSRHFHTRRVERNDTARLPQVGHWTPLGHRNSTM